MFKKDPSDLEMSSTSNVDLDDDGDIPTAAEAKSQQQRPQVIPSPLSIRALSVSSSNRRPSSTSNIHHRHQDEHLPSSRQYWRDIILGVNDGLVSTFLLVAGVAGSGWTSREILITALAGALAGALSMCAGEYVATKSQNEVLHGEIALEKTHVRDYLDEEIDELQTLLGLIGISDDQELMRENLTQYYRQHPESLLQIMVALEFGVLEREERSPFRAGFISCLLFFLGTIPSVIPFCITNDPFVGLIVAAVLTTGALFFVGAIKTWASRGHCVSAAIENLVIAGCGGAIAYSVGRMFDLILKK